jgi:hypothetical protein
MAFETVTIGHAEFVKDLSGAMGRMAIYADRHAVRFLFPEFAPDDLAVNRLDLTMTFLTGLGHVVLVYRRASVRVWQNIVRRMAIGAYSGNGQALPEKTLAVYALGIVRQYAVLRYIERSCYLCTFLVAASAHVRDIEFRYP